MNGSGAVSNASDALKRACMAQLSFNPSLPLPGLPIEPLGPEWRELLSRIDKAERDKE